MPNDRDVQELLGALRDTDDEDRATPRRVPTMAERITTAPGCGHTPEQHRNDDGQAADDRSKDQAIRELEAERDQANADAIRFKTHLVEESARLREHLTRTRTERDEANAQCRRLNRELDDTRAEITAAWAALNAAGFGDPVAGVGELISRLAYERDRTAADLHTAKADTNRDIARQIAMLAADPPLLRDWLTTCQPLPTSYAELLQALAEKIGRGDQPHLGPMSPSAQAEVTRLLVVVEWHGDYYGREERVDVLREWIEGALTDRDDTPGVTITEVPEQG
ncbi:hypothetical protein [Micromonospora sp. NPDC048839]|uniref:hypothetical protein n=1 Tax=Micromonospora sp. NPDC048839 TaxID=3155641 RepID=UPI0033CD45A0